MLIAIFFSFAMTIAVSFRFADRLRTLRTFVYALSRAPSIRRRAQSTTRPTTRGVQSHSTVLGGRAQRIGNPLPKTVRAIDRKQNAHKNENFFRSSFFPERFLSRFPAYQKMICKITSRTNAAMPQNTACGTGWALFLRNVGQAIRQAAQRFVRPRLVTSVTRIEPRRWCMTTRIDTSPAPDPSAESAKMATQRGLDFIRKNRVIEVVVPASMPVSRVSTACPAVPYRTAALFGFFIAPLFGTVLLGMLWKRVTSAGGFLGLLAGTTTSITLFFLMKSSPRWVAIFALSPEAKGLAQAMYQSLWSCTTCVVVTILVTLVTKPRPDEALRGLVYSLTDVAKEEHASLFRKPVFWGMAALVLLVILQIIFW